MSRAGNFQIVVGDPYPVWCELRHNGETVARFTHKELSDLHYAAEKAMREARVKLTDQDKEEV